MNDLTLCSDMSGIPLQQRMELHAQRHKAVWTEAESLEHAHDALAQCKSEREKAQAELKKQQQTHRQWDFKQQDLFRQWKELETPSRSTRFFVKLRHPVNTDQAYADRDVESKQKEEEHQHAFWQGEEYKRAVEETEARIDSLEADIERYELEAENHRQLDAEVKAIHSAVFAGVHHEYRQEMELRDRIDVVAAHGVEFAEKLDIERKALRMFPDMLDEAERSARQFKKAMRASSDHQRRHARKAEDAYERARKMEKTIHRLKPSVTLYPTDMPSFSFLETGDFANLFRRGYTERKAYCKDLIVHMHRQWDIAKQDENEMAQGVKELNIQVKVLKRKLEQMHARILLNKAAEMGLGGEIDEQEINRLALQDGESVVAEGGDLMGPIDWSGPTDDAPPPAYSKH